MKKNGKWYKKRKKMCTFAKKIVDRRMKHFPGQTAMKKWIIRVQSLSLALE